MLLQRVLYFKCKDVWKRVEGREKNFTWSLLQAITWTDFTIFTLLMLILTGRYILRGSNELKKTLLNDCILAATYNFFVLHNHLFHTWNIQEQTEPPWISQCFVFILSTDQSWCSLAKLKETDKKEIPTAHNPLAREITKQCLFLTWCSVRQWVESKCKNLWSCPCFFFISSLKVVQNSQKHPEYKTILWDKVSPLERTVAADVASSFSMALPLQTLPGLMGNIYTGKNPSVFDAWPPV